MDSDRVPVAFAAMEVASLRCRLRLYEPAYSLLQRLAARAGKSEVIEFLKTVPRCPTGLYKDAKSGRQLSAISVLSGVSHDLISRYTPIYGINGGVFVGDVLIAPSFSPTPARGRICPECLAQDRLELLGPMEGRAHRRFWWDLPSVFGCPVHAKPLLHRCPRCDSQLDWNRPRPDFCLCEADLSQTDCGPVADASLDQLVVDLMLGKPFPTWAEGMSIAGISGLALRLGIAATLGPAAEIVSRLGPAVRMDLASKGASLLAGGLDSFSRALDSCISHPDAKVDSPHGAYGDLQRWLQRGLEPGLEPYKQSLLKHAFANLRCKSETTMFNCPLPFNRRPKEAPLTVAERRTRSTLGVYPPTISSLADELGCSPERIISLSVLMDAGNSTKLSRTDKVSDEFADLVLRKLRSAVSTKIMQQLSGLRATQLVRLLAVDDRDRIAKLKPRGADLFDVDSFQAFLASAASVPVYLNRPEQLVKLMDVGQLRCRWPEAVKAVRDGRLSIKGTLNGGVGLFSLLLDPEEVRETLLAREAIANTLTVAATAKALRISVATVTALHRAGIIEYAKHSGFDRRSQGPTSASVQNFERKFIVGRHLSQAVGRTSLWLSGYLAEAGVTRVVSGAKSVQAVYPRVAAERAMAHFQRISV